MTNEEIIEQLENTIGLIKQDGKDWLDDRDIPILEACIKSLTALDKIRVEIEQLRIHKAQFLTSDNKVCIDSQAVLEIIDKYREEQTNAVSD